MKLTDEWLVAAKPDLPDEVPTAIECCSEAADPARAEARAYL
jgi:hypothetical protein